MSVMKTVLAASLLSANVVAAGTLAAQQLQYPKAHTVNQVDDYFGTKVADPYRWMEDDDAADVKQWVDAENALTHSYIDAIPGRAAIKSRLMELTDFERYSVPVQYGGRYFYSFNTGLQNQSPVFWKQGLAGEAKLLLDPNTLSKDGTVALDSFVPTEDGRLVAYTTAEAGSDWQKIFVRDVATGKDLTDHIEWTKFPGISWKKDASGFFYSGYEVPKGKVMDAAAMKAVNSFQKIYYHKLGTPQSDDKVVFERPDDKELYLDAGVTDDGKYLVISQNRGGAKNAFSVRSLEHPEQPPVVLAATPDAMYVAIDNDGSYFWVLTTLDAPNGRVIGIDLKHPERANWKTVIPETKNKLDGVSMVHDTLIARYLADAQTKVVLYKPDGMMMQQLELPAIGTAMGFGGRRSDKETFFAFTNFTTPSAIYRVDMTTLKTTVFEQPKLKFDPNEFETRQVFYPSKDGTKIPMFLSYKKGLKIDANTPTLLYGYGGFDISLEPAFSPSYVVWMEMGGIYAQANLRGGGEYGQAWHDAGSRHQKQNVFDDFIAAAEWLIANKYTSTPKLAIKGESNGGLLVGACETQRPELYGAALPGVGVMDMLRFDKFTVGFGWKPDYGAPSENKEDFEAIYKYSPLHNIRPGVHYPPTLITTADHDDRVFPAHSFKFAATMQKDQAGPNPILIRIETRAGHGGGMPLSKRLDLTADQYIFLVKSLGMTVDLPK